ncbi:MAG: hypothetical protein RLY93_15265 [Sumerlaeia bacterium]
MEYTPEETADRIAKLEALAEMEPDDALTHFLLGQERLRGGRFVQAAEALARCVELDPEYTAAYRFLGDAYRKAQDPASARAIYEKGVATAERTGDLQAGREMAALLKKLTAPE